MNNQGLKYFIFYKVINNQIEIVNPLNENIVVFFSLHGD